jgi:hypothetical protein
MALETNRKNTYLDELLLCKKAINPKVKKSNQKFTPIGNKLISKDIVEKFTKIAKVEETKKAQKIKQFKQVKNMIESSGFTSINQISYGSNSITVTNRRTGEMKNSILGEI